MHSPKQLQAQIRSKREAAEAEERAAASRAAREAAAVAAREAALDFALAGVTFR